MAFVKFKKVNNVANMPDAITEGNVYFVKDVNKIFADLGAERTSFSISEVEAADVADATVDTALQDILTALEAIEATLLPDVEDNYEELLSNLKEIGQYSTTAEVQDMIAESIEPPKVSEHTYGIVTDGVIKLNKAHDYYKVNLNEQTDVNVDTTDISPTTDVITFYLLLENPNHAVPNFIFSPTTLDTADNLVYTYNYTLLNIKGFRVSNTIKWTLGYCGGWNS